MFLPSLLVTLSQGGGLRLSSTARVGRGPSQGARSASTEDIGGRAPLSSFQARSLYSLKDRRDCCCGHQSPVEVLALAKRRGSFLRVVQPVRRSVRR